MGATFGERLKALRESEGWSQPQLADRAGLHWQTVAKTEQGIREPSFETAYRLAEALGVSLEAFRQDDGMSKR